MNEYGLMLLLLGAGLALAWVFFRYLARLAIWSRNPLLDTWRYRLITAFLALQLAYVAYLWQAALLVLVSLVAYRAIQQERTRLESAVLALRTPPVRVPRQ